MKVYLDNAATTAVDREVFQAMLPYFSEEMGNAQSVHSFGRSAKAAIEQARRQVASLINADPTEIIFLSGGTEADNLAILGAAHGATGRQIITTRIEHPAVLAACESLEQEGFQVTYLDVDRDGAVSVESVKDAITNETILITIMHANNETGALQPIEEIGRVVAQSRAEGSTHLRFHTDAVQSTGKMPIDVDRLGVDLLSISAHKFHGPKGAGALYARKDVRLTKLLYGGHHERDRRPGTENVTGIVGLGKAAELALARMEEMDRVRELRDYFERELRARVPDIKINASADERLPNISNMTFHGIDGEALLIALDLRGIAASTGSACSSGSLEPSHVLTAMGLARDEVRSSLRFSLSRETAREEIDYALCAIEEIVPHLRLLSEEDEEAILPLKSQI
ncbi:MAG TPA: cysteine desulfurase family protein [Blastocatellia bacterium]